MTITVFKPVKWDNILIKSLSDFLFLPRMYKLHWIAYIPNISDISNISHTLYNAINEQFLDFFLAPDRDSESSTLTYNYWPDFNTVSSMSSVIALSHWSTYLSY